MSNKIEISKEQVDAALNEIRPALQTDGGDVELIDVQDGVVTVRLTGACHGCPMAQYTLQMGVERLLREKVKGFQRLEAVGMNYEA